MKTKPLNRQDKDERRRERQRIRARARYREKIGKEPRPYRFTGEHIGGKDRRRGRPILSDEERGIEQLKYRVLNKCGFCELRLGEDWVESDNISSLGVKYRLHPHCADVINRLENNRSEVIRGNKELGYQQRKGSYCTDVMGFV